MQRLFYTLLIMFGLIVFEVMLVSVTTTYMPMSFSSPVLGNLQFYVILFQDAPLTSLKLIFIDQPLFVIEAKHAATTATVWSLHYFGLTVLVHVVISLILANIILRTGAIFRWKDLPVTGSALLLLSSLYLFLGSCCAGGPNWIVHTGLLSFVFNPTTSSNVVIQLYQSLHDGFVLLQILTGVLGGYLLLRKVYTLKRAEPF